MGYNSKTARDILFGPTDCGGAGLMRLSWLQGEAQLLQFFKHWRSNTLVSQLLRIYLHWYQHIARVGFDVLDAIVQANVDLNDVTLDELNRMVTQFSTNRRRAAAARFVQMSSVE